MECFEELFIASGGKPVRYRNQIVQLVDQIEVTECERWRVCFESVDSEWRQGVHLSTAGTFGVNKQEISDAIVLWQDTAPRVTDLIVQSSNAEVFVKNVWDTGNGTMHSWHGGAAMIVERLGASRVYRCNDGECDTDFDDLVFSISKLD